MCLQYAYNNQKKGGDKMRTGQRQKLNITLEKSTIEYLKMLSEKYNYPVSRIIEDLITHSDSNPAKEVNDRINRIPF